MNVVIPTTLIRTVMTMGPIAILVSKEWAVSIVSSPLTRELLFERNFLHAIFFWIDPTGITTSGIESSFLSRPNALIDSIPPLLPYFERCIRTTPRSTTSVPFSPFPPQSGVLDVDIHTRFAIDRYTATLEENLLPFVLHHGEPIWKENSIVQFVLVFRHRLITSIVNVTKGVVRRDETNEQSHRAKQALDRHLLLVAYS